VKNIGVPVESFVEPIFDAGVYIGGMGDGAAIKIYHEIAGAETAPDRPGRKPASVLALMR
jgi:hypothetical protein